MIVITTNNCFIIASDISRLVKYQHVQSIFMVALVDGKGNGAGIDFSNHTQDEIKKSGGLFHDYESLFDRLQELLNEANEIDDDFFSFFNRPEKALRDLRFELGPYIWSQSLRGEFTQ